MTFLMADYIIYALYLILLFYIDIYVYTLILYA